jgi:hypothetical protein
VPGHKPVLGEPGHGKPGQGEPGGHEKERLEFTGKVAGIIYDRFGDFEGFLLRTEEGREISFRADARAK